MLRDGRNGDRLRLLASGPRSGFGRDDPGHAACQRRPRTGSPLYTLDFLGDAEPWKLEWTTTTRPHDWLFIFSGTMRARVLHPLKFGLVPAIKRFRAAAPLRG